MTHEGFEDRGRFWNPEATEFLIRHTDAQFAFEHSGAHIWLAENRVTNDGAMDLDETAHILGITLVRGMPIIEGEKPLSQGLTTGLGVRRGIEPIIVYLSASYSDQHALIFGHELGHVFLETVAGLERYEDDEHVENFCEQFGRHAAVPPEELCEISGVTADTVFELTERYDVDHSTVIHQLMLAGKLPKKFIMDTSNPEFGNPLYSHKVMRHTFCFDCSIGRVHTVEPKLQDALILDGTAYEWSDSTDLIECGSENHRLNDEECVELNKRYGR